MRISVVLDRALSFNKHSVILILLHCAGFTLHAQEYQLYNEINIIPPSPNATSIIKYTELPVSHFTGTPDISIPIWNLTTPQLSLPINLKYHAAGMRVEEQASWVGAGWTLNAGGVISRTVRGLPDELKEGSGRKGYFFSSFMLDTGNVSPDALVCETMLTLQSFRDTTKDPKTDLDSLARGILDGEPDHFSVSALGLADRFVVNKESEIIKFNYSDTRYLSHPFDDLSNPGVLPKSSGWQIQGDDGTLYTFQDTESTMVQSECNGDSHDMFSGPLITVTSWYLTEVSLHNDWIRFEYEDEVLIYHANQSEQRSIVIANVSTLGQITPGQASACYGSTTVEAKTLKRIYTSNGYEVIFKKDTLNAREDIIGGYPLHEIEIKKDGSLISRYILNTSYFGSSDRLKLDKVVQADSLGNELNEGHVFEYNNDSTFPVPGYYSKSQDLWGFYNRAVNTPSMIPEFKDKSHHVNKESMADRNPDLNATATGVLKRINYPTGGYTTFEYELNEYYNADKKTDFYYSTDATMPPPGGPEEEPEPDPESFCDFTVAVDCSVTLWIDSHAPTPTSYTQIQQWDTTSSTYQAVILQSTVGNRHVLPHGAYRLYAYNTDTTVVKYIRVEFEQPTPGLEPVGGLRIKEIQFHHADNKKSFTRKYTYMNDSTSTSSGVLFRKPSIGGYRTIYAGGSVEDAYCGNTSFTEYINLSSHNQSPVTAYNGSHIGYGVVQEFFVDNTIHENTIGKTEYSYSTTLQAFEPSFPFVPGEDESHKNGKILSKRIYAWTNSNYVLTHEERFRYAEEVDLSSNVLALNMKPFISAFCYDCSILRFNGASYKITPKWYYLTGLDKIEYADSDQILTQTTYSYLTGPDREHHLPVSEEITTSRESELIRKEYTRDAVNPALINAVSSFRNNTQVSGESVEYSGKLPVSQALWNSGSEELELKSQLVYYSDNKLKERISFESEAADTTAYVWGYGGEHLTAVVKNSSQRNIAFSSFESDTDGGWTVSGTKQSDAEATTGEKVLLLSGTVTKSALSTNTTFVVSYWKKSGTISVNSTSPHYTGKTRNGWTYYEHIISNPAGQTITVSGTSAVIDELRLYPARAQMSTFTYKNGVGVTSATDANNVIRYYVYDAFGRLKQIEDADRNIIQTFTYNYQMNEGEN